MKGGGTFGDKFTVDFWRRIELGEHNHSFSNFFSLDALECKGGGLAGGAHWYRDTFSLNGPDVGCRELAEAVGTNEDSIAGVDYSYCVMSQTVHRQAARSMRTAFDNTRDNGTDERNGEGIIHVEFERRLSIVVAVVRQDIQECPHQVEALASNIGDLEDRAYSLADKLCCGLDGLVTVLDKNGNLLCAR